MFEIIIISVAVILMIWACIFSWRLDNGASEDVESINIDGENNRKESKEA